MRILKEAGRTRPAALSASFRTHVAAPRTRPRVRKVRPSPGAGGEGGMPWPGRSRHGARTSTLFASRYYAPIVAIDQSISIISLLLGTTAPTLPSVTIPINRTPTISEANITVSLV